MDYLHVDLILEALVGPENAAVEPSLPLPETAGQVYGKIRADLQLRGEMIGNNDLWIAAHAIAEHFVLVTNNEKEFSRVRGLKVQNWVA